MGHLVGSGRALYLSFPFFFVSRPKQPPCDVSPGIIFARRLSPRRNWLYFRPIHDNPTTRVQKRPKLVLLVTEGLPSSLGLFFRAAFSSGRLRFFSKFAWPVVGSMSDTFGLFRISPSPPEGGQDVRERAPRHVSFPTEDLLPPYTFLFF